MNLLLLTVFAIICAVAVEARYPYEDSYTPGDIVPHGFNTKYPYVRDGGYTRKHRRGGYAGILHRKNNQHGNGRYRDTVLGRDYRRRHRDYDSYLPPRGIGGYKRNHDRSYDYEGGRYGRPQIDRPPKYYDEDEISYGGYTRNTEGGRRYS